jgi:hypothetical protein
MDPNKTLEDIRRLLDLERETKLPENRSELSDLVDALDEWLSQGGFLPADWQGRKS